jgi:hypothetical protein
LILSVWLRLLGGKERKAGVAALGAL